MSDEEPKGFHLPSMVLKDIWDMYHWGEMREDAIKQELLRNHAINYPIKRIKSIINMVESWKKDGKTMYLQYGLERKEWRIENQIQNQPIEMVRAGRGFRRGRSGNEMVSSFIPRGVPASIIIQEKKIKKTRNDVIKIIMDKDCEYCNFYKKDGKYDALLEHIKKKYDKQYYITEVLTSGNPIEGFKNSETREIAMYFMSAMGEIPAIFDVYFPGFFMQGPSWGVFSQFRMGIHLKLLFEAIDTIHTQKLLPPPIGRLPPPYHTGKYAEIFGLGTKKGFRKVN